MPQKQLWENEPTRNLDTASIEHSSADPLAGVASNPQSLNLYTYVYNNPMNFEDPSGLCVGFPCPPAFRDRDALGVLGFYFGPRCTLDGAETSCGLVGALLGSGATAVCPNNSCNFVKITQENKVYSFLPDAFFSVGTTFANGTFLTGVNFQPGGWYQVGVTGSFCDSGPCLGVLSWLSNFTAGAGDTLSGGVTLLAREELTAARGVVNYNSGAYVTGVATAAAMEAASGATGAAVANGKYGSLFGRGGKAFFNRGPVRFGWSWEGSATAGRDVIRLGIGAARGTHWWNHIPFFYP